MYSASTIRILVLLSVLLFWTSHWMGAHIPDGGIRTDWVLFGIILMLIKTLPLWIFVFLVKEGRVKINQYLTFAATFYALVGFWNAFGELYYLGYAQIATTCYLLWILVIMGRQTKIAFKAQKKAEADVATSMAQESKSTENNAAN